MTATTIPAQSSPARTLSMRGTPNSSMTNVGYGIVPKRAISRRIKKTITRKISRYNFIKKFHLHNVFTKLYKIFYKEILEIEKEEVAK
jgi:hypothetical protein